jgi:hypothetical protein
VLDEKIKNQKLHLKPVKPIAMLPCLPQQHDTETIMVLDAKRYMGTLVATDETGVFEAVAGIKPLPRPQSQVAREWKASRMPHAQPSPQARLGETAQRRLQPVLTAK